MDVFPPKIEGRIKATPRKTPLKEEPSELSRVQACVDCPLENTNTQTTSIFKAIFDFGPLYVVVGMCVSLKS